MSGIDRAAAWVGRIGLGDVGALVLGPRDVLVEEGILGVECMTTYGALAATAFGATAKTAGDGDGITWGSWIGWRRGGWIRGEVGEGSVTI